MSDKNAQPAQQRRSMKSSAQLERRRFERAPITAQVEYELTNSSSGPSRVRRNVANISLGGLFITTEEPIRTGTRMVVRFELPNRHRVIAVSRVCYARKGLGLGLYIVQQIALAHGATCEVDSNESGTTFKVRWPRAPGAARRKAASG